MMDEVNKREVMVLMEVRSILGKPTLVREFNTVEEFHAFVNEVGKGKDSMTIGEAGLLYAMRPLIGDWGLMASVMYGERELEDIRTVEFNEPQDIINYANSFLPEVQFSLAEMGVDAVKLFVAMQIGATTKAKVIGVITHWACEAEKALNDIDDLRLKESKAEGESH